MARAASKALAWSKVNKPAFKGKDELEDSRQTSDSSSKPTSPSPLISEASEASDDESTSSSASSSSDSSSDSNAADSAPEQATSKRQHPTRVPPPPRRPPKNLCRRLLATGHCYRGAECHYSHDLPDTLPSLDERRGKLKQKRKDRVGKAKGADTAATATPGKERRKGLWQVMVEKEEEEERKQVLRAIVFMGENGMLGEDGGKDKAEIVKGAV